MDTYKQARAETIAKFLFEQGFKERVCLNTKDFWIVSHACYNDLIDYSLFFSVRLQWHLRDKDELLTCLVGHNDLVPEGSCVLVPKDFPYERGLPLGVIFCPVPLPV